MLVLVRHGEATANAAGLLLGRSDVPLTDRGRGQARSLAGVLGPAVRLVSSPLERAMETARLLDLEVPIAVDDRWVEVNYGEHEGRALADIPASVWEQWRSDPEFVPAGGESLAAVGRRVTGACQEAFAHEGKGARDPVGDMVVVSHVSPIKAAVGWALGAGDALAWRLHLSTGSVTRIGFGPRGPVLHGYNWVPS